MENHSLKYGNILYRVSFSISIFYNNPDIQQQNPCAYGGYCIMKSSFQKKLFLKSSIIIISMVLIFLIFFSNYVYREISKTSRNNLNELAAKTGNELTLLFDDMDKISLYVSTNPDIISCLLYTSGSLPGIVQLDFGRRRMAVSFGIIPERTALDTGADSA